MSASLSGVFSLQEFSDGGVLLVGGHLYTYTAGTTTQKTAYTDAAGAVPQTYTSDGLGGQYIALNARGELPAPLFLTTGAYDITLKRADGTTVWTRQAVPVGDAAGAVGALLTAFQTSLASATDPALGANMVGYAPTQVYTAGLGKFLNYSFGRTASEIAGSVFPTNYAFLPGYPERYGAVGDGSTSDQTALQACFDGNTDIFLPPNKTYLITGIIVTTQRKFVRGGGYTSILQVSGAVGSFGIKFISPSGIGTHFGSGARLMDFRIICTATANQIYGIWCANAEVDAMERVFIDLSGNTFAGAVRNATYAFLGDYQQDGIFVKCHFTAGAGAFADGVFLTGNLAANRKPNNNLFLGCRAQSNGGYGVRNSIGDGNIWDGGKLQNNGLGGWIESDDGSGNGPSNTVIRACGFEINTGNDLQVDVANHLVVNDVVFQSVGATNHINVTFANNCHFDRIFSFPSKPVNIAGGSGNVWDMGNRGFGALTFAASTMTAIVERRSALVDAASVLVDASKGTYFTLTGTTARAIAAPTNSADGQRITFEIENTSGGAITHTWDPNYRVSGWGATPAGKISTTTYQYNLARFLWIQVGTPILNL